MRRRLRERNLHERLLLRVSDCQQLLRARDAVRLFEHPGMRGEHLWRLALLRRGHGRAGRDMRKLLWDRDSRV